MVVENLTCENCGATMRDFVKPVCVVCGGHEGVFGKPWICKECGGLIIMKCTRCGETKRLRKSPQFPFMA